MPGRCLVSPLWIIPLPLGSTFPVHLSYLGSSFSLESSSHENTTQERCALMYDAIGSEGTYPVELTSEDFPRQTVTLTAEPWRQEIHPYNASGAKWSKALSSVPLQFTLTGQPNQSDCRSI